VQPQVKRRFKDTLFEQFARIGRALGNGHRIELIDLLAQAERSVDELASQAGLRFASERSLSSQQYLLLFRL